MNDDADMWLKQDLDHREWELLEALQKVYRAGLKEEALLLAFEGGVLTQFKKEIEHARNS